MQLVGLDGPGDSSIAVVYSEVTVTDRMRLGIELITSIQGPLTADLRVLPPGELRVNVRISDAGIEATLVFADVDEKRELTSVQNIRSYRSRSLKTRDLQSLPLRQIRRELRRLIDDIRHDQITESLGGVGKAQDPRPEGRPKTEVTDDFLLDLAAKYHHLDGQPGATEILGAELNYPGTYIRQLLSRARSTGFLQPTTPGKKNSDLTTKARRLLAQRETTTEGDSQWQE